MYCVTLCRAEGNEATWRVSSVSADWFTWGWSIERIIEIKTGIRLIYARYRKHTEAHKFSILAIYNFFFSKLGVSLPHSFRYWVIFIFSKNRNERGSQSTIFFTFLFGFFPSLFNEYSWRLERFSFPVRRKWRVFHFDSKMPLRTGLESLKPLG